MSGYSSAEYGLLVEKGGRLALPAVRQNRMGKVVWEWPVRPHAGFGANVGVRLVLRYTLKRPEVANLTLILRDVHVARMDTHDSHRQDGVLRCGTHVSERPDPLDPRGRTTYDLDPPLEGFPDDPAPGTMVRYWVPVEWFCRRYNIDCTGLDRDELEEEVPPYER